MLIVNDGHMWAAELFVHEMRKQEKQEEEQHLFYQLSYEFSQNQFQKEISKQCYCFYVKCHPTKFQQNCSIFPDCICAKHFNALKKWDGCQTALNFIAHLFLANKMPGFQRPSHHGIIIIFMHSFLFQSFPTAAASMASDNAF